MKSNRGHVRPQFDTKQKAIEQFLVQALANDLITESQSSRFQQVLLAPKSNGAWRFCVDYRTLNMSSDSYGWPISNIKGMHHANFKLNSSIGESDNESRT